jgi:hypothetical protein
MGDVFCCCHGGKLHEPRSRFNVLVSTDVTTKHVQPYGISYYNRSRRTALSPKCLFYKLTWFYQVVLSSVVV